MKIIASALLVFVLFLIAIFFGGCGLSQADQEARSFRHCIQTSSIHHCREYIRLTELNENELRNRYTAEGIKALADRRQQVNNRITSIQQEESEAIEIYKGNTNSNSIVKK